MEDDMTERKKPGRKRRNSAQLTITMPVATKARAEAAAAELGLPISGYLALLINTTTGIRRTEGTVAAVPSQPPKKAANSIDYDAKEREQDIQNQGIYGGSLLSSLNSAELSIVSGIPTRMCRVCGEEFVEDLGGAGYAGYCPNHHDSWKGGEA